jgi:hypothetical protein
MEEKQFEVAITEAVTNTAKSVEMLSDAFMRHQETLQTLIEHVKQLQSRVDKLEGNDTIEEA